MKAILIIGFKIVLPEAILYNIKNSNEGNINYWA